jgi:hypothetical protein
MPSENILVPYMPLTPHVIHTKKCTLYATQWHTSNEYKIGKSFAMAKNLLKRDTYKH